VIPSDEPFPLHRSDYYRVYLLEKSAIDLHKWLLSEKMGHDVGISYAQYNWTMGGHRQRWLESMRASGEHV
jgi:hypothetical protein